MCLQLMMPPVQVRVEATTDGCQLVDQQDVLQPDFTWQSEGNACTQAVCAHKSLLPQAGTATKLLVTWTPLAPDVTESSLRSLLQQYGDIQNLTILQHPLVGDGVGCAILNYTSRKAAEAARMAFDKAPLQQKPSKLQTFMVQPLPQHITFSASLITSSTQSADTACIGSQIVSSSSIASHVVQQCIQQQQEQQQKNRGFEFKTAAGHLNSMAALQQSRGQAETEKSCSQSVSRLVVQDDQSRVAVSDVRQYEPDQQRQAGSVVGDLVDHKQQQLPRESEDQIEQQQQQQEGHTLFFAKVPRSASKAAVLELFNRYGDVVELELFAESPDCSVSKGCGLIKFAHRESAVAVLEQLGGKYTWQGMRSPMVLKLMDPEANKQQQQDKASGSSQSQRQHVSSNRQSTPPAAASALHSKHGHSSIATAAAVGSHHHHHQQQQQPQDRMPPGCAPDAYKLFIGNVPRSYGTSALRKVFEAIGPVAEVVIIRDKLTSQSKGSAFVWFYTKRHADQAVEQFNMRLVLPSCLPDELLSSKPMVVRKASQQSRQHNASPFAAAAAAVAVNPCILSPAARAVGCCSLPNSSSASSPYPIPTLPGDISLSVSPAAVAAMLPPQLLKQGHTAAAAAATAIASPQVAATMTEYQRLMALGANAHSSSSHSSRSPALTVQDLVALTGQGLPLDPVAAAAVAAAVTRGGLPLSITCQGASRAATGAAATPALLQQQLLQQMVAASGNPHMVQQYGPAMHQQQRNLDTAGLFNQLAALQLHHHQQQQLTSADILTALPVHANLTGMEAAAVAAAGPSNAAGCHPLTALAAAAAAGSSASDVHCGRLLSPLISTEAALPGLLSMQATNSYNGLSALSGATNASSMHTGYPLLDTVCPTAASRSYSASQCISLPLNGNADNAAQLYGALCAENQFQAALNDELQFLGLPMVTQGLHLGVFK